MKIDIEKNFKSVIGHAILAKLEREEYYKSPRLNGDNAIVMSLELPYEYVYLVKEYEGITLRYDRDDKEGNWEVNVSIEKNLTLNLNMLSY